LTSFNLLPQAPAAVDLRIHIKALLIVAAAGAATLRGSRLCVELGASRWGRVWPATKSANGSRTFSLDMLTALCSVATRDGSDLLRYFVELAVAQAKDDYTALDRPNVVDCAGRTRVSLH
jgi:hypothetical protein